MQMSDHPADLAVPAALGLVYYGNALICAWGLMEMDASAGRPSVCLGRGAAQKHFPTGAEQQLGSGTEGTRSPEEAQDE